MSPGTRSGIGTSCGPARPDNIPRFAECRWFVRTRLTVAVVRTITFNRSDAGGISTYAQTGAKTGSNLLWAFIILVPMAYYVQEMTVRLGAVTKRGHVEAIFDGFGKFWGWFSIFDLAFINWLTLVTEYIGMTQAMRLFNIPEWITFLSVTLLLLGIVITGRYWTFEKITLFFCLFNLVYIPAAIWAMHTGNVAGGWSAVGKGFFNPQHGPSG
jgi:Mn2+/Fe2+ NRAMP family transporter